MIQPTASFSGNLQLLPSIEGISRIDLINPVGEAVAEIENVPGKQGSLVVYHYLEQCFGKVDAVAAAHGLEAFAEHTLDAKNRHGAHPNIDRSFEIVGGTVPLSIRIIEA